MALAQALRDSNWQVGQVALVGRVECPSPAPIRWLAVGHDEFSDRDLAEAERALGPERVAEMRKYLHRETSWRVQAGLPEPVIPALHPAEEAAFTDLWLWLGINNRLRPRTITKQNKAPTDE